MSRRSSVSAPDLVERARAGEVRAVARLVSLVEDESPLLREVMTLLAPHAGRAQVIGVTGSPGVGKSTTTNALVRERIARGQSPGQVRSWLVERYGDYVTYDPPFSWLTAPLWATPILLIAIGLFIARRSFGKDDGTLPEEAE